MGLAHRGGAEPQRLRCRLTDLVAGLDEAGRGPLAGPVVSSCVVWEGLPALKEKVNDSKLLSEKEREYLFGWILENAYKVTVGVASPEEIERLNIHYASLLSMERAVRNTALRPRLLLVDGLFPLKGMDQSKAVVKGDRKCFFIACASIVAKVVRDRLMAIYDAAYPHYNWKKNKGYPTWEHKLAIERFGISPLHRRTFRGVKEYCGD
ncbi:MAG: ribonuclease HII [Syntrophorhabdales bacterium]|jgi:ribonuclease HII